MVDFGQDLVAVVDFGQDRVVHFGAWSIHNKMADPSQMGTV